MQSNSIREHALKIGGFVAAFWGWLALAAPAQAGQYQLLAEQANTVVVAARVQNAEQVCNLEITVQGQTVMEREVQAPYFEARIDITPQDVESVAVTWRGKSKRVNDVVVNACPTQGGTQYPVVFDNAPLRAAWASLFSQMNPAKAECVRMALQADRVRYEWFDLNGRQGSPEDWRIQRALTQCDGFVERKKAWGDQPPKNFACVLPGGLKTRCEGYYSATENGKSQPISLATAVQRQLENRAWSTGVRETAAAKGARQKEELAAKARIAAEELAKVKAEEEARIREAQLAKEAIEAQARERQEKAEADHVRRLQELERLEQVRLEKRSWMLKQLEKLKRDPKADDKAEDAKSKNDKPKEAKPEATKPEAAKPEEVKPK
jgi:hypothetical protein